MWPDMVRALRESTNGALPPPDPQASWEDCMALQAWALLVRDHRRHRCLLRHHAWRLEGLGSGGEAWDARGAEGEATGGDHKGAAPSGTGMPMSWPC